MNNYFNFGSQMAAALGGVNREELNTRKGQEGVMSAKDAIPFNRQLCKIAAAAYTTDGDPTAPAAILFQNLSNVDSWHTGFNVFSDCVKRSLAKQAMLLPVMGGAHSSLGSDTLKTLVATGALGGATVGSLAFMLGRNASQTSAENAALLEKVRAFKQLRRDIDEDLAANEVTAAASPKGRTRHNV